MTTEKICERFIGMNWLDIQPILLDELECDITRKGNQIHCSNSPYSSYSEDVIILNLVDDVCVSFDIMLTIPKDAPMYADMMGAVVRKYGFEHEKTIGFCKLVDEVMLQGKSYKRGELIATYGEIMRG